MAVTFPGSARIRGGGPAELWRSFRTAARLGWKMEANWTDPVLFFIYSVAKPVASVLILVFMVNIVSGGQADARVRGFVVVGSSLWAFVMGGVAGLGWSILDDRERYRMLRYLYVSPSNFVVVLLGRGLARIGVALSGALITLTVGVTILGVPFDAGRIDWPALVVAMTLGLGSVVAIGLIMAAICIQTRQEAWSYPEAVAGALFLVSGAVFPLRVLPEALQVVGLSTPLTWWMEGVRRALFAGGPSAVGGPDSVFASITGRLEPSSGEVLVALLLSGALVTLAATVSFRWSERRAKDRGLFDLTSGS